MFQYITDIDYTINFYLGLGLGSANLTLNLLEVRGPEPEEELGLKMPKMPNYVFYSLLAITALSAAGLAYYYYTSDSTLMLLPATHEVSSTNVGSAFSNDSSSHSYTSDTSNHSDLTDWSDLSDGSDESYMKYVDRELDAQVTASIHKEYDQKIDTSYDSLLRRYVQKHISSLEENQDCEYSESEYSDFSPKQK